MGASMDTDGKKSSAAPGTRAQRGAAVPRDNGTLPAFQQLSLFVWAQRPSAPALQRAGGAGPTARMPSSRCSKPGLFAGPGAVAPSAHFPAVPSGSLIRFSSLSSLAISTSGPFFTTWPFFSCGQRKERKSCERPNPGADVRPAPHRVSHRLARPCCAQR